MLKSVLGRGGLCGLSLAVERRLSTCGLRALGCGIGSCGVGA